MVTAAQAAPPADDAATIEADGMTQRVRRILAAQAGSYPFDGESQGALRAADRAVERAHAHAEIYRTLADLMAVMS